MTAPTAASECTPARIAQLAASYCSTQAAQRNALATESHAAFAATRARLQHITQAVRVAGHVDLADALDTEASTGAVLLTPLTADDETSSAQITSALVEYQEWRRAVDGLRAG